MRHELEDLAAQALSAIGRLLPLTDLDVLVFPSTLVPPELGVNGYAENGHLLHLKLDPPNPNSASRHRTAIPALLAHGGQPSAELWGNTRRASDD
ncbi:hypothetical protein [uncultured Pseudacidovorax sp.]|uniref:hypothetical protein n=1 Tax=uncultured Pseudacidovorax sp. TaxID=679313 RepID=UPI0025FEB261|nr:hypothetical protein [uncultured Pseudacidovorax sp.]